MTFELFIMFTILYRIIKSGFLYFWRNKWLSGAAISVMSLAILIMVSLVMLNTLTHNLIRNLQDKVDVSVYFKLDAPEGDILELRMF